MNIDQIVESATVTVKGPAIDEANKMPLKVAHTVESITKNSNDIENANKSKDDKEVAELSTKKNKNEKAKACAEKMDVDLDDISVQAQLKKSSAQSEKQMKASGPPEECPTSKLEIVTTPIDGGAASLTPSTPSQTPPQVLAIETTAAAIPDNILSPPKSETQTDETNTATSTSSSPASETQLSPVVPVVAEAEVSTTPVHDQSNQQQKVTKQPTTLSAELMLTAGHNVSVLANGSVPKSGKPLATVMNKKPVKMTTRSPRVRKSKGLMPMYESEISDIKIGIKLCIKKSDNSVALAAEPPPPIATPKVNPKSTPTATVTSSAKPVRKRSRKKPRPQLDSDESETEPKKKKERTNNNSERQKKVSFSGIANDGPKEPFEQSMWGSKLPEGVLFQIFQIVVARDGCMPTLFRLGRVCALWRRVSLSPTLWRNLDLTAYTKEKLRIEHKVKWLVDNRCSSCTELNVSNCKVSDIQCFLTKLVNGCSNLVGITLAGWKGLTIDHLAYLVDNMKKLERLDLSSINVEMNASKTAVGVQSLCNALQNMNSRLTHLNLAHNRLAGIPQLVNILSTHCPNLELLDLSNVTTQANSHGVLHIEKLQHGCQKLKVLRVTSSHITPSTATVQEMMDSPGFPNLEELSLALTHESRIISDEHLQRILKSSSKLKLLDVRNCTRLTHESLIRLPTWDIKHLFLSGCSVTRDFSSGLELIASKWAHSLIELDLAWANVQQPLDNALRALAEKRSESPLAHLNLCGSSVSEDAVKDILANCASMSSINLASCRGLPRGVKRLMQGPQELKELREVLKVQMKVKLPTSSVQQDTTNSESNGGDGDGGGGSSSVNN